ARFFFSSRRRHTRSYGDWSSDVCSSDLVTTARPQRQNGHETTAANFLKWFGIRARWNGRSALMEFPIEYRATRAGAHSSSPPLRSEERRVGKGGRSRCGRAAYEARACLW